MKIEKLTENKIRIILNIEDLEKNNVDFKSILSNSTESQTLLLTMLNKAEKEVGFYTKDCKILIEAFGSSSGQLIFTITKFSPEIPQTLSPKKRLSVKRKLVGLDSKVSIYCFKNFDAFCDFCNCLSINISKNLKQLCKSISLYLYNDTYYLIVSNINTNFKYLKGFYSTVSEFASFVSNSNDFESKLLEHGKIVIKNNAIKKGFELFRKI